ncbi:MAG: transcription termination/antitermination protein NusG [Mycoplasmoidaceae bacterium]
MIKDYNKPQWYIATTITGSEESIYTSLLDKIKAYQFDDLVKEMRIVKYNDITIETFRDGVNPPPKTMRNSKNITWETTPDGKYIKKTTKTYNKFPGYLFICMVMTEEVWYAIRNTPGITGFVGSSGKGAKPIPISEFELDELFDPDKNKDIIRHINAASVSIEEVDHVEEEQMKKDVSIEFFNSKAYTATSLSTTRKIDFEKRQSKADDHGDTEDHSLEQSNHQDHLNEAIITKVEMNSAIEQPINEVKQVVKPTVEPTSPVVNSKQKVEESSLLDEFKVGNTIKIIEGSFSGNEALITRIENENKVLVCEIDLFGRNIEVKLKKNQVEK